VGPDFIKANGGTNMSAPLLAAQLGGPLFFSFISAIAFATILAVVAGLTISASTSFAHDFWTNVVHHARAHDPLEEVRVARVTAFVVGGAAMAIAIYLGPTANVAFLVGLAFAVAASANLPVIVLSLFWKRFNTAGAVMGLATGLVASIALIAMSPAVRGKDAALFPLDNPGIVSIPLGFLGAWLGTMLSKEKANAAKFTELQVRSITGLGAEKGGGH
jgi:cation/acetate symporter